MKSATLALACLTLCACVTTSEVTPVGRDTLMVTTGTGTHFTGTAELAKRSADKATNYCKAQGKEMVLARIETQEIRGFTVQENTLLFHCVPR